MARSAARLRSRPVRFGGLVRGARGQAVGRGQTIGLFGGSFDPVHEGHMHVAITAMKSARLDRIWWLVSPQNPLKTRRADSYETRLSTLRDRIRRPGMSVCDFEDRLGSRHTAALLSALKKRFPSNKFVWIMGADNLAGFHKWWAWKAVMCLVPVLIVSRPQDPIRARLAPAARLFAQSRHRESAARALPLQKAPAWTYLVKRLHSHSSTALRARR